MCDVDDPKAVYDYDDDPLPGTSAIEAVIAAAGDDPQLDAVVRRLVERSWFYVLGQGAPGGTHMYLLHAEVPMGYQTITMLPAFTRFRFADEAILMNPAWIYLGIWIVKGTDLLAARWPNEHLGVNVWSGSHEFKLAPEARYYPRCA